MLVGGLQPYIHEAFLAVRGPGSPTQQGEQQGRFVCIDPPVVVFVFVGARGTETRPHRGGEGPTVCAEKPKEPRDPSSRRREAMQRCVFWLGLMGTSRQLLVSPEVCTTMVQIRGGQEAQIASAMDEDMRGHRGTGGRPGGPRGGMWTEQDTVRAPGGRREEADANMGD